MRASDQFQPQCSLARGQPVVEVAGGDRAALGDRGQQRGSERRVRGEAPLAALGAVVPIRCRITGHSSTGMSACDVRPVLDQPARTAAPRPGAAGRRRRRPSGSTAACSARAGSTLTESTWSTPVRASGALQRAHRRHRVRRGPRSPARPARSGGPGRGEAESRGATPPVRAGRAAFPCTAYMTASMRECSCSFSRMLRTWFFTVFSEMNSCLAISRLLSPVRHQPQHLELALGEPERRALLALGLGHLLELVDQLDRHRRADQRLALGDHADGLRDLLDRGVLEQVAGGTALDGLVEVGLLVGDGQHDDLGRRVGLLDRPAGLDAGARGIRTSSSTTSGASAVARSVAAMPSPASPTTSMSGSCAQQHREPSTEQLLVVDDEDADRLSRACRLGHTRHHVTPEQQ